MLGLLSFGLIIFCLFFDESIVVDRQPLLHFLSRYLYLFCLCVWFLCCLAIEEEEYNYVYCDHRVKMSNCWRYFDFEICLHILGWRYFWFFHQSSYYWFPFLVFLSLIFFSLIFLLVCRLRKGWYWCLLQLSILKFRFFRSLYFCFCLIYLDFSKNITLLTNLFEYV